MLISLNLFFLQPEMSFLLKQHAELTSYNLIILGGSGTSRLVYLLCGISGSQLSIQGLHCLYLKPPKNILKYIFQTAPHSSSPTSKILTQ